MIRYEKKTIIFLLAVIGLIAFLSYGSTLYGDFVWDDIHYVQHPLNMGSNPYAFFTWTSLYYRPFIHLSVALDYCVWHLNPLGYHLTNVLLHALCSLLTFFVALYLLANTPSHEEIGDKQLKTLQTPLVISFVAAILFALHPIHTESVAWISGRTDILTTLFFLLAFLAYLIYVSEGKNTALILSSLFFLFSLFSKENAISLIGIVFIYGIATRIPKKKIFLSEIALFFSLVIYLVLRSGGGIKELAETPGSREAFFSPAVTLNNFFSILSMGAGYYFEKLVFPLHLNILPELPEHPVYYLVFLLPLLIGFIWYFRGKKLHAFLMTWIIVTLLPSLSILFSQVANPVAERYLYLPSTGFTILAALFLGKLRSRKIALAVVCSVLLVYSVTTVERVGDWKNDLTLWEDTALKNPESAHAQSSYAAILIRTGDVDTAREKLLFALNQRELSFAHASKIFELLGVVETRSGNYQKAEEYLLRAIKTNDKNSAAHNNLGFLYANMAGAADDDQKKSLYLKAIKEYEESLRLSPNSIYPLFNIGLSYMHIGNLEKSQEYFDSVIRSDPRGQMSQEAVRLVALIKSLKRNNIKGI